MIPFERIVFTDMPPWHFGLVVQKNPNQPAKNKKQKAKSKVIKSNMMFSAC